MPAGSVKENWPLIPVIKTFLPLALIVANGSGLCEMLSAATPLTRTCEKEWAQQPTMKKNRKKKRVRFPGRELLIFHKRYHQNY
jgi:hypothetical protein